VKLLTNSHVLCRRIDNVNRQTALSCTVQSVLYNGECEIIIVSDRPSSNKITRRANSIGI